MPALLFMCPKSWLIADTQVVVTASLTPIRDLQWTIRPWILRPVGQGRPFVIPVAPL